MKRRLEVLDISTEPTEAPPIAVRLGERLITVYDSADGSAARRFAEALVQAGAHLVALPAHPEAPTRIVIRVPLGTAQWRLRSEALERDADLVLGSCRPQFAKHFALACAQGVSD